VDSSEQRDFHVFLDIVKNTFIGENFVYKNITFKLAPTLVAPYDFIKKIKSPSSEYERLLLELGSNFRRIARTEMYRRGRGWIARGISDGKIKEITMDDKHFLVPILSPPTVGIDTSGVNNSTSIIIFCFMDNSDAGIVFLEKYLLLSKTKGISEFKWNKLDSQSRSKANDNLNLLLNITSCGSLAIHTNVLSSPIGSRMYIFRDLIEGCFSGYEKTPAQPKNIREGFRQSYFSMCNDIPIHCDADFRPLSSDKIARFLVSTLSKKNDKIQKFTPLHAELKSEESSSIQIADIVAGAIGMKIKNNEKPPTPYSSLYFDNRKINKMARKKGKSAKAYFWFRNQ
jgi:hypothetical protein